jgi:putative FmdB family regulatory protein
LPTYQYSCTECGHFFEQFQSFSEDSLTVCPECEGRLRKVFNAVGVVFKGSGFYRTDSRTATTGGDAAKPAASGSSVEGSSGESSSSGSSGGSQSTSGKDSSSSSGSTTAGSAA